MKYTVKYSTQFKKDYKKAVRQKKDISHLQNVIGLLANGETLPPQYKDHVLSGNFVGKRECHIEPDWLLIYEINNGQLLLILARTGSHSELFQK